MKLSQLANLKLKENVSPRFSFMVALHVTVLAVSVTSLSTAFSSTMPDTKLPINKNCSIALTSKTLAPSALALSRRNVLIELAELRSQIHRAQRDRAFPVARTLSRQYDTKLTEAVQLGISPDEIKLAV